ncbi:hypothetical protein AKJ09_06268 [Labilithrix luteola]|uniref:Hemerythrin-like domain-containing protein n=1 Tax=Labilithrix luteola TaxID=1391654 RepID=A0A0K1Q2J2_9BACT|nr:hemerythrin domain-containing protein [Labilithrix luteola]AKU99604.1 hypothetical protein AKJ09_06268 [Labilithrix luteola]
MNLRNLSNLANLRHNIYRDVHKGLRRELASLVTDIGMLDARTEEFDRAAARFRQLRRLLEAHHDHEDVHIGPHLKRHAPRLFEEMEKEHGLLAREIAALSVHADAALSAAGDDRIYGVRTFYMALGAFMARYFLHMDEEERSYLAALQAAYTDAELGAIEGALVGSIAPDMLECFMAIMLPAMNPDERAELLAHAGAAPAPASRVPDERTTSEAVHA